MINASITKRSKVLVPFLFSFTITFLVVVFLTNSILFASAFSTLAIAFTYIIVHDRKNKHEIEVASSWPEVIDHIISGIQSGISLSEAISELANRGPRVVQPIFLKFRTQLLLDGDFEKGLRLLSEHFKSHAADQIFQALIISKSLGGTELLSILRTLGNFLRQDLALRREISVKQSSIKNSAYLSSAAPWLLLLLLALQPTTVSAFTTPAGALILFVGLAMTTLAYIWMTFLSRLPEAPRVFGRNA